MKAGIILICIILLNIGCKSKQENKNLKHDYKNTDAAYLPGGFKSADGTLIDYPSAKGFVNDFAQVLTVAEQEQLDSLLTAHEKSTTNEIAIIIFDTIPIAKAQFDDFTLALANKWGIGKKETNNGVAICLCIKMQKIRIQNGRGIEKILSESATKKIIDSLILPEFKEQAYYKGLLNGVQEIIQRITPHQ